MTKEQLDNLYELLSRLANSKPFGISKNEHCLDAKVKIADLLFAIIDSKLNEHANHAHLTSQLAELISSLSELARVSFKEDKASQAIIALTVISLYEYQKEVNVIKEFYINISGLTYRVGDKTNTPLCTYCITNELGAFPLTKADNYTYTCSECSLIHTCCDQDDFCQTIYEE